jgi:hypothetical protein
MNKLQIFNDRMIELSLMSDKVNVPIGFTMSTFGHFKLHFSKEPGYRAFDFLEDLIDYVIKLEVKVRV